MLHFCKSALSDPVLILVLLAEGCTEWQVASGLKVSKTAIRKKTVKQETLGMTGNKPG